MKIRHGYGPTDPPLSITAGHVYRSQDGRYYLYGEYGYTAYLVDIESGSLRRKPAGESISVIARYMRENHFVEVPASLLVP